MTTAWERLHQHAAQERQAERERRQAERERRRERLAIRRVHLADPDDPETSLCNSPFSPVSITKNPAIVSCISCQRSYQFRLRPQSIPRTESIERVGNRLYAKLQKRVQAKLRRVNPERMEGQAICRLCGSQFYVTKKTGMLVFCSPDCRFVGYWVTGQRNHARSVLRRPEKYGHRASERAERVLAGEVMPSTRLKHQMLAALRRIAEPEGQVRGWRA